MSKTLLVLVAVAVMLADQALQAQGEADFLQSLIKTSGNEIEVRPPSSYELYRIYLSGDSTESLTDLLKRIYTKTMGRESTTIRKVHFRVTLDWLLGDALKQLDYFVQYGFFPPSQVPGLTSIIGLYLMQYDGESFEANKLAVQNEREDSATCRALSEVYHFGKGTNVVLTSADGKKLLTLLAIHIELSRQKHNWIENVHKLLSQVKNGTKKIEQGQAATSSSSNQYQSESVSDIVLPTPSSYELMSILVFGVGSTDLPTIEDYSAKLDLAKKNTGRNTLEFNSMMDSVIQNEITRLFDYLNNDKTEAPIKASGLPKIIGLYLTRYYDAESFLTKTMAVQTDEERNPTKIQLAGEFPLSPNSFSQILTTDVQQKFIELLGINMELKREYARWSANVKVSVSQYSYGSKKIVWGPKPAARTT